MFFPLISPASWLGLSIEIWIYILQEIPVYPELYSTFNPSKTSINLKVKYILLKWAEFDVTNLMIQPIVTAQVNLLISNNQLPI